MIVGSITTNNNKCWQYLYGLMASLLHKWFRLSCKNKIWPDAIVYLTKFTEPQYISNAVHSKNETLTTGILTGANLVTIVYTIQGDNPKS